MKKSKVSIYILLVYCVPYVFLGMYGDYVLFSIWPYILIAVAMIGLSRYCKKTRRIHIALAGNVLSFLSSYLFTQCVATEKWNYYFKAFPATIRTVEFSIIMLLVQIVILVVTKSGKKVNSNLQEE